MTVALLVFSSSILTAQMTEDEAKKELKSKTVKSVKKDAKNYTKQGYYVAPGSIPLEKMLESSYVKQELKDEKGVAKYLYANATSVAETQIAAQLQALEAAKLNLAGQIDENIGALIEQNVANAQLNNEEAASVTKMVAASKSLIAQELGRTDPVVIMYRKLGSNIEANVMVFYDFKTAFDVAKKTIRKNLEDETKILQDKLDKLFKFEWWQKKPRN